MKPIPILLFGKDYWRRIINFEAMAEEGVINPDDLDLFTEVETAEEAWEEIVRFYELDV
jgi:predicted Rossmann-fold nucleotide-binding protein